MGKKLRYIDLFSGCGGLSLGLEKAGFELALSVEKSDMAAETFYHNFIKPISSKEEWQEYCSFSPVEQAKQKLLVDEVSQILENRELQSYLCSQEIDFIAGGPPCQGFSMAGRRNPNDKRNQLPWQFLDVVEILNPKAVLIENVVGMSQNFVKHDAKAPFNQLKTALEETGVGYNVQQVQLNAMHFGVPQHRPRVLLLAIRKDLDSDFRFYDGIWRSDFDVSENLENRPDLAPLATNFGDKINTVKNALCDISDNGYNCKISDKLYKTNEGRLAYQLRRDISWFPENIKPSLPKKLENHNLRNHAEHIQERFRLYQSLRDNGISSRILNVPKKHEYFEAKLLIKEQLIGKNDFFIAPDGVTVAKSHEDLIDVIMRLGTKKHSQRPLNWDKPSPTVVSLPDDYVHPHSARSMTVRELARFQGFPDSFIFKSKETTGSHRRRFEVPQYTQVGNAVPPIMAEAIAKKMYTVLCNLSNNSMNIKERKVA